MHKTNHIAILGLLSVTFLLSSFSISSASAASATITTNNNITLNTSSAGDGVTIDEESINITTTCNKGYDLTIATSTSTNLYLNGDSTVTAAYTAVDGTSALNSTNNTNKWGYTTTSNPTSSTVFSPLSTTASTIRTIAQTTTLTSETIPIYYGIKTDNTVDPGTYSMGNNGVITYYLTMNPLCYIVDIAYDGNNADAGTMGAVGTGVIHTGVTDGDTVDLIASNFSRSGYGFAGWSLDPDAGTKLLDNDNTNNPVVYGPQETVTLPEGFADNDTDNDGIVKLYAVWLQSQGNLQGWMGCASLDAATYDSTTGKLDLTKNSVTALTDMRDHDTYAVARLADGNCWMIENLRLEAEDTRGNNRFDSSITNESLAQGYGTSTTYGNFGGLADAESTNFSGSTTANSLYYSGTQEGTASIDIGTSGYPYFRMPRYNNLNTPANANNRPQNPTSNTFAYDNTTVGMYSYGNYYTWAAAIADTTYSSGDHNTTSICPTGWQLPLGNTSTGDIEQGTADAANRVGGFSYLDRKMGGTGTGQSTAAASLRWRTFPNNFLYSGNFADSSANARGSSGSYWSSTGLYEDYAFFLALSSSDTSSASGSGVYPTTNTRRYFGFSIRCTVPGNLYAIHFDANTTDTVTGTMANQTIAVDESAQLNINSFQRPATSSAAYRFVKWNTEPNGSGTDYADGASVTNLAAAGQTITLYAQWEQVTPMTVNFNGNGLSFADSSIANTVYYTNTCSTKYVSVPSYSHTSNINDNGTQIGTTKYNNNLATKDVITIPGATSLHATITYGTENNWDMLYVFQGEYTGSVTKNMSAGQLQKYMGGNDTTTTVELDIPGDTATFAFYSDSSGQYWGYHASVVGYYDAEPASYASTTQVCRRSLINGEYKTPNTGSLRTFCGWSENQSATTADYATADEVLNNLPGNNGETKTLYAIWRNNLTINYNANGGTGTTASQTVAEGETITLKSNNFTAPANMAFGGWNTEPDGTGTSYSANTTFTAPNSVAYNDSLTLYAQWIPQYKITYVDNCKSWASSDSNCTDAKSVTTSDQMINLTNNPSTGTETGTLGAYNKFTMTGWKIKEWTTNADGSGTIYPTSSTYTVPAGSSVGDGITLYAHWVPIYTVQYDGNGSDNDSKGMGSTNATTGLKSVRHTDVAEGDTFDLFASNFKKAGYGFVGWSTDSNAWTKLTDNDSTNDAKIWGPNEVFTAPAPNGTPITTLYAVWAPAETSGGNPVYLQGWTGCSTMTATTYDSTTGTLTVAKNSITALTDERDGNVYAIAKLADENCWMIENLRLADTHDESGSTVATTLSTSNTNIDTNNNTLPITNIYSSSTTSNSLSPSSSVAYNASSAPYGWCTNNNAACYNQSRLNTANTVTNATPSKTQSITSANAHSDFNTTVYAYGNYYNWYSATAGYGTYSKSSGNVGGDLCPAGWKLPYGNTGTSETNIGNTKGGFYYLANQMSATGSNQVNSNKFRIFPNNFIYSGYRADSAYDRGNVGSYWSASAFDGIRTYYLFLGSTLVHPGNSFIYKYYGHSVRCVSGS